MKKIFVIVICAFILLVEFQITSCSRLPKRPADLPKLTPCTISVTFGGEVMQGVGVLMIPVDKEANKWSAGGITNQEGKATMVTSAAFQGVVPGEYIISFKKTGEPVSMDEPPPIIPQKYLTGKSKETVNITTDQSEYTLTLEGLPK
ncbi:MAG: hypothetical protein LBJ00_06225 [Planctomycetaceae bacterium]|jgi:hypothetical protein|nr:hypothetical protein [Planctomycetaceae bacterium]